ncbi:MAG: hypothetical protein ACM3XO_19315 [Bacteroidota bacterium]
MAFKDIRKSRKWLSPQEIRIIAAFLIFLAALLALNLYLANTVTGGEWLLMRWNVVRSFMGLDVDTSVGVKGWRSISEGEAVTQKPSKAVIQRQKPDIYGGSIAHRIQQLVYGRNAFATEYKYIVSDPFPILLLYTPLTFLGTFPFARALWMLIAEAALLVSVLFSYRLSEWDPPLGLNIVLIAFALFGFFSLNALLTASPAILLNLLYLGILLALRSNSDELAGALLFLVAYQWELGGFFFLFIIIFILANRRWGVLAGFGMALIIFLIISFLTNPGWGLPYFRAALSNLIQGQYLNLGSILSGWFPEIRFSLGTVISVVMVGVVLIESIGAIHAPFRRVVWVASLALAAMPLAGLAIFPANNVVLILPLVLVTSLIWERWPRTRLIAVILLFLAMIAVPYYLYYQTLVAYEPFYTELLYVIPSVVMVVALYWMRWWVVHAPRVWADRIGNPR